MKNVCIFHDNHGFLPIFTSRRSRVNGSTGRAGINIGHLSRVCDKHPPGRDRLAMRCLPCYRWSGHYWILFWLYRKSPSQTQLDARTGGLSRAEPPPKINTRPTTRTLMSDNVNSTHAQPDAKTLKDQTALREFIDSELFNLSIYPTLYLCNVKLCRFCGIQ